MNEYEEVMFKLETMNKGANVHTIYKVQYHLENMKKRNSVKLLNEILELTKQALATGDWSVLKKRMALWF